MREAGFALLSILVALVSAKSIKEWFAPYTVYADWDYDVYRHKAWTKREALQWAACYPKDAVVLFRNRNNQVTAWRG